MSLLNEIKSNSKKKINKKIIFVLLLISVLLINFIFNKPNNNTIINDEKSFVVKKWDLKNFIEADGKIILKEDYDVDFKVWGIIKDINNKPWDSVKKWDLIATLDDTSLLLELEKAKISLNIAKANYEIKKRWSTQSDVNIQKQQYESSLVWLNNIKSQVEIDLKNSQDNVKILENNIENAKKQSELNILNSKNLLEIANIDYSNALSNLELIKKQEEEKNFNAQNKLWMQIWAMINITEKLLFDIDVLLGVTEANRTKNDGYEIYLWAKDSSVKNQAIDLFLKTQNDFDAFYIKWQEQKTSWKYDLLNESFIEFKDISSNLNKLINLTINVLKNSIDSYNFSQTIIDSHIVIFEKSLEENKTDLSKITESYLLLQELKTNSNYKIDSLNSQLILLKQKITQAENVYNKTILENDLIIESAQDKLEQAISLLESTKIKNSTLINKEESSVWISKTILDSKTNVEMLDLEPYKNSILLAEKNLKEVEEKLNNTKLYSPINWKIVEINWVKWQLTSNLKSSFATIINTDIMLAEIFVDESDIFKVNEKQNVYLNFDSVDWLTLTWNVVFINDKAKVDDSWLVNYKVDVIFNSESKVKDWMTTTAQFITKEINNALIIPVESVKTYNKKPSVKLETWKIVNITTWFTDWKMVEVINWLSLWDKIIF